MLFGKFQQFLSWYLNFNQMIFFFWITLKFLKHLQPPANFVPSKSSEGEIGIGLMKVSADLQYGGATKYLVFLTKAIHKPIKLIILWIIYFICNNCLFCRSSRNASSSFWFFRLRSVIFIIRFLNRNI